jgi:two-component system response regulator RegX3
VPRDLVRLTACSIDVAAGLVYRDGGVTPLRGREHRLLRALLRRHGRPASRAELQREVCGREAGDEGRGIANHVVELRRKIEAGPGAPRHLLTVRNGGYRLVHAVFPDRLAAAG